MKEVIRFIVRVFINIFYKAELVGLENIPKSGSALLCANHVHEMDMFFIGYKSKRLIHYMAKEELFKIPVLSGLVTWLGAFPVTRGKADVGAIKTALKLLEEGHIVGIFPEGTRTKGKQKGTVSIKRGVAMIAISSGAPIIPVSINASYRLFSKVRVVFGKPYYLDVEKDKKYSTEEMNDIARGIMERVYSAV